MSVFTTARFRKALCLNKKSLKDSELFSVTVTKAIFCEALFCRLYDIGQRNCNSSSRADILEKSNEVARVVLAL